MRDQKSPSYSHCLRSLACPVVFLYIVPRGFLQASTAADILPSFLLSFFNSSLSSLAGSSRLAPCLGSLALDCGLRIFAQLAPLAGLRRIRLVRCREPSTRTRSSCPVDFSQEGLVTNLQPVSTRFLSLACPFAMSRHSPARSCILHAQDKYSIRKPLERQRRCVFCPAFFRGCFVARLLTQLLARLLGRRWRVGGLH